MEIRSSGTTFEKKLDDENIVIAVKGENGLNGTYTFTHGGNVTRAEAFGILWEDRLYDRPMQKQMDVIIRSMRTTLQEYGIERIFELKHGTMRICPDQFTCDAYQFFEGNLDAINSFGWISVINNKRNPKLFNEVLEPVQYLHLCGWRSQIFRHMKPKPQAILCVLTRILAKYVGKRCQLPKEACQTCVERYVSRL